MSHIPLLSRRSSDFSPHVEKLTPDLTPQPSSLQEKGEQLKPLPYKERGLERGFPDPVKSKVEVNNYIYNLALIPNTHFLLPIYNF
ncbi:unknown protein [Nostoc sp. NIES-3756]|nr:unknown protein [Nostoc sp. NIES-3756]